MTSKFSATLSIDQNGTILCSDCEKQLCSREEIWKNYAIVSEQPMERTCGSTYTVSKDVLLRQFYCPECGSLLDSEIALSGDPFLNDTVRG
ncbi:MAG: hypothetical protein CMM30_06840 [Rhodospirillaceae bacterium]|nr:hypothetical protein [Rhodospirillaceae bacterium]|tara:strand:+ start:6940 stop:7212 length:273 start_codon:yes stop_codon:yes gene_type:complete